MVREALVRSLLASVRCAGVLGSECYARGGCESGCESKR